jgi:hypothetical protein
MVSQRGCYCRGSVAKQMAAVDVDLAVQIDGGERLSRMKLRVVRKV